MEDFSAKDTRLKVMSVSFDLFTIGSGMQKKDSSIFDLSKSLYSRLMYITLHLRNHSLLVFVEEIIQGTNTFSH